MDINQVDCILDLSLTNLRLSIIDKNLSKEIFNQEKNIPFFENKQDYFSENTNKVLDELIKTSEKNIGLHITNLNILTDNKNILTIDISVKKNFEGKIVSQKDVEFLELDAKNIILENYKNYNIIHSITQKFTLDDNIYDNFPIQNPKSLKFLGLSIKFICLPKIIYQQILNLLNSNHLELNSIGCSSYIKSKSYNNQFSNYYFKLFLDIGYDKTILNIYEDEKLRNFFVIKIGGLSITRDISKVMEIELSKAEKIKKNMHKSEITFSDKSDKSNLEHKDLIKKIIYARIEEILNLSFKNIDFFEDIKNNKSILIFTGQGSKILENNSIYLNELFDSFDEIHYLEELSSKICMAGHKFLKINLQKQLQKPLKHTQNKGFFEKIFKLFSKF